MLVGLGNPGAAYDGTRHNVGFAVIDAVARRFATEPFRQQKKSLLARARIGEAGADCLLVKPQTFMNLSGQSVGPLAQFYKLDAAQIVVVHDELDFATGQVRLKAFGGHGGHNGLRSLKEHLPGDFGRIRIGIGKLAARAQQVEHVLGRFAPSEKDTIADAIDKSVDALVAIVTDGFAAAMNQYNR